MGEKFKIGFVGWGRRGRGILKLWANMPDVEVTAVCDIYEDRQKGAADVVKELTGKTPLCTGDYRDLLKLDIDAVINCCSWADHVNIIVDCLNAGVPIGFEVGGAYNVEECWEIVRTQERTGTPCMMLTNTRYAKREMALVRMVKEGFFGEVVHCDGGYGHYMADQVVEGHYNLKYYRLKNFMLRNSENYPCHAMGTIANILDINRGNKIVSISSVASSARGIHSYVNEKYGPEHELADVPFSQGDIITTTMKCARGETITLRLDNTLPRAYSRNFQIHGTKGMFMEDGNLIFLKDEHLDYRDDAPALYNNADAYIEKHLHPLWQDKPEITTPLGIDPMNAGHGGTDQLVARAFIDSVRNNLPMVTDVYDAAMLMAITPLSEESIIKGGAPVIVPDFTKGRYLTRKPLTSDDTIWSIT